MASVIPFTPDPMEIGYFYEVHDLIQIGGTVPMVFDARTGLSIPEDVHGETDVTLDVYGPGLEVKFERLTARHVISGVVDSWTSLAISAHTGNGLAPRRNLFWPGISRRLEVRDAEVDMGFGQTWLVIDAETHFDRIIGRGVLVMLEPHEVRHKVDVTTARSWVAAEWQPVNNKAHKILS